jgi:hypothetical protein
VSACAARLVDAHSLKFATSHDRTFELVVLLLLILTKIRCRFVLLYYTTSCERTSWYRSS